MGWIVAISKIERLPPMIMAIEHKSMVIITDIIKSKLLDMSSEVDNNRMNNAFLSKDWHRWHHHSYKINIQDKQKTKIAFSKSVKSVKEIRFYKCKQLGHYMNKCPNNQNKSETNAFSAIFMNITFHKFDWYVHSGANSHMITDRSCLEIVTLGHKVKEIVVANKEKVPVICSGSTMKNQEP